MSSQISTLFSTKQLSTISHSPLKSLRCSFSTISKGSKRRKLKSNHCVKESVKLSVATEEKGKIFKNESLRSMYPIRVIAHPTSDITHPSLLLHAPSGKRYMFGAVPEGLQRTMNEQKLKISRLSTIFLTGELNWSKVGGLPGLILTVSDQGKKDLTLVHGSDLINYVVSTWRYFVFRFGMNLDPLVLSNDECFEDEVMTVQSVVLKKHESSRSEYFSSKHASKLSSIVQKMFPLDVKANQAVDIEDSDEEATDITKKSDPSTSDPHIHVKLPHVKPQALSTSYVIHFKPIRGKFLVQKANELGLPKGRLYQTLASGEEVTLEDGTIIKPEQVLSAPRMFQSIVVLDVPSKDFLEAAFQKNWGTNTGLVFHFLSNGIDPFSESYVNFINSFGPDCQHNISHPSYSPDSIVFTGGSITVLKLKTLMKDNYNIPYTAPALKTFPPGTSDNIKVTLKGQSYTIEASNPPKKIIPDESIVDEQLSDWQKVFEESVAPLNLNSKYSLEEIVDKTSVSASKVDERSPLNDQVETITLGTGSALPSKYRNVISTLIRIPFKEPGGSGFRSVLLDAGENTLGALKRTFGGQRLESYFKELKLIYLSHLHADHHLGIMSVINEWIKHNKDNNEKLYLVTPWQYNHFLHEAAKLESVENIIDRIVYISCESFLYGKARNEIPQINFENFDPTKGGKIEVATLVPTKNYQGITALKKALGIKKFATCRAYHCDWAYCCSITFTTDSTLDRDNAGSLFKVSYSGDTRPNKHMFAKVIGGNSDLLIHEATLENELQSEAKAKRHCTINEAIGVANEMQTKKLILTHFSQRYPKLPEISNSVVPEAAFSYAFDGMIVNYKDIENQQKIFEELNKAFPAEDEEVESES